MKVRQNHNQMYILARVQPEGGGSCHDIGGVVVSTWGGEKGKQGTVKGQEVR